MYLNYAIQLPYLNHFATLKISQYIYASYWQRTRKYSWIFKTCGQRIWIRIRFFIAAACKLVSTLILSGSEVRPLTLPVRTYTRRPNPHHSSYKLSHHIGYVIWYDTMQPT